MVETNFGFIAWKERCQILGGTYWEKVEERERIRETRPVMFDSQEKVA